jgi:protein-disulfide isomerase
VRLPSVLACAAFAVILLPAPTPTPTASAAGFSPEQRQEIQAIVNDYLTKNPEVLIGALKKAEAEMDRDADAKTAALIALHRHDLLDNPQTPVGGNPQGKVSLVEFFDYRCPYCKATEPALEKLAAEDSQLRLVYKEFPILGPVSVTAAHAALAAKRQGKYDAFHRAMMAARGNITDDTVFTVAKSVGLDIAQLKRDMAAPEINEEIAANMKLADAIAVSGTPAFIVGDQLIPGEIDLTALKKLVADPGKK